MIATRNYTVVGLGYTGTTATTSTTECSSRVYYELVPNLTDYSLLEKFTDRAIIEEMKTGWLKPHKQLKPFNNTRINFNLPRSRLREKKQIFLLKAA